MKFRFLVLACSLSCALVMGGQAGHPVPPGIREADKLPNPADIPPQVTAKRPRDGPRYLLTISRVMEAVKNEEEPQGPWHAGASSERDLRCPLVDILLLLWTIYFHQSDELKKVSACFVIRRPHFRGPLTSRKHGRHLMRVSVDYYDACTPFLGQCRWGRCRT
jgi:hypothetical protein